MGIGMRSARLGKLVLLVASVASDTSHPMQYSAMRCIFANYDEEELKSGEDLGQD